MLKDGAVFREYEGDDLSEQLIYHDLLTDGEEQ